jgi:hypothetical protein
MRRPAEVDPAIPYHVAVERQTGETGDEGFDGDAAFQPGQRRA